MRELLDVMLERRAIKVFEPVAIPQEARTLILDATRSAPSSFNIQPYRFIWVESPVLLKQTAHLCLDQSPARTASALVVAIADLGSWRATAKGQIEWMRFEGFEPEKIADQEKRAAIAKWFFLQGWFGVFGVLKWLLLRILNCWKIIGSPPVGRRGMFQWATKSTALACENLMIAAEALGLNTCPMEGFDGRRLSKLLKLSPRYHEIVMVIAIGKKSPRHTVPPQWRRPIEATVETV